MQQIFGQFNTLFHNRTTSRSTSCAVVRANTPSKPSVKVSSDYWRLTIFSSSNPRACTRNLKLILGSEADTSSTKDEYIYIYIAYVYIYILCMCVFNTISPLPYQAEARPTRPSSNVCLSSQRPSSRQSVSFPRFYVSISPRKLRCQVMLMMKLQCSYFEVHNFYGVNPFFYMNLWKQSSFCCIEYIGYRLMGL